MTSGSRRGSLLLAILLAAGSIHVTPLSEAAAKSPATGKVSTQSAAARKATPGSKPASSTNPGRRPLGRKMLYSTDFGGNLLVYVRGDRSAIYVRGSVGDIIIKMPRPDLPILVNPDNKTFFYKPTFKVGSADQMDLRRFDTKVAGNTKLHGLNCSRVLLLNKKRGTQQQVGEMWMTEDLQLPRQITDMLCSTIAIPPGFGVPIRITLAPGFIDSEGEKVAIKNPYLELKDDSRVFVEVSKFKVPNGYVKAKSYADFMFSSDGKLTEEEFEDFFRQPIK